MTSAIWKTIDFSGPFTLHEAFPIITDDCRLAQVLRWFWRDRSSLDRVEAEVKDSRETGIDADKLTCFNLMKPFTGEDFHYEDTTVFMWTDWGHMGDKHAIAVFTSAPTPSVNTRSVFQGSSCLWGEAAAAVFVNMIGVIQRQTDSMLGPPETAPHFLWHNQDDNNDDGRHGVWGQAWGKHRRPFERCRYVKASPGSPCTLTPAAESCRPSGRSIGCCCCRWRRLEAGSGPGVRGRLHVLKTNCNLLSATSQTRKHQLSRVESSPHDCFTKSKGHQSEQEVEQTWGRRPKSLRTPETAVSVWVVRFSAAWSSICKLKEFLMARRWKPY